MIYCKNIIKPLQHCQRSGVPRQTGERRSQQLGRVSLQERDAVGIHNKRSVSGSLGGFQLVMGDPQASSLDGVKISWKMPWIIDDDERGYPDDELESTVFVDD